MPEHLNGLDVATIGVMADTHLPYRTRNLPEEVLSIFADVNIILHAGDVDRIQYLQDLSALAPLHAVRGNFHFTDLSDGGRDLPTELQMTIAGRNIVVTHGGWPNLWSQAGDWFIEFVLGLSKDILNQRIADRLARRYTQADAIIFGHSHRPYRAWHDGTLIFNPGAVCPTAGQIPSVGKLYVTADAVRAEVVALA